MNRYDNEVRMRVKIKKLHDDAHLPAYAHGPEEDAGLDIRSVESATLKPGIPYAVSTGLSLEIPSGYEVQIRPRSGLGVEARHYASQFARHYRSRISGRVESNPVEFRPDRLPGALGRPDCTDGAGALRTGGLGRSGIVGIGAGNRRVWFVRPLGFDLGRQLAGKRLCLTGILVAGLLVVRNGDRRGELFEGEGADSHARVQCNRHDSEIAQL